MFFGYDIVIDNMNLNSNEVKFYESVINPKGITPDCFRFKYELETKDFFIPLQDCINPIGKEVIRKYKNILEDGKDNSSEDTSGSLCSS